MRLRRILAANLQRLRQQAGVSQEELAHRAKIDRTYVSALERERYAATVEVIERIAVALQVDPAEVLAPLPEG